MKFGIIGSGKVAEALCQALLEKKQNISGIYSRNAITQSSLCARFDLNFENSLAKTVLSSEIIFICVADMSISEVAKEISNLLELTGEIQEQIQSKIKGKVFLHTSGACTSDLLVDLKNLGGYIGSLHPLQTFSGRENFTYFQNPAPSGFENINYFYEGEKEALSAVQNFVTLFHGNLVTIEKEKKALYHLCATMMCNYSVALSYMTEKLFGNVLPNNGETPYSIGLLSPFRPIVEKTFNNIFQKGGSNSLTGPISRGDTHVIKTHIAELQIFPAEFLTSYKALGKVSLVIAREKGNLSNGVLLELDRLLS